MLTGTGELIAGYDNFCRRVTVHSVAALSSEIWLIEILILLVEQNCGGILARKLHSFAFLLERDNNAFV